MLNQIVGDDVRLGPFCLQRLPRGNPPGQTENRFDLVRSPERLDRAGARVPTASHDDHSHGSRLPAAYGRKNSRETGTGPGTKNGGWLQMSETVREAKLLQYLNEAYGKERELQTALEAHIAMTSRKPYLKRLRKHLTETKGHGRQVER